MTGIVKSKKIKYLTLDKKIELEYGDKVSFPEKQKDEINGKTKGEIIVAKHYFEEKEYEPIDKYIEEWLNKEQKNFLIILGEYGTGKSTLCEYLAFNLAEGNIDNNKKIKISDTKHRTPIIFNLRDLRDQNFDDFLISQLGKNVNEVSFMEFKQRLEKDEFILIFDGFDEMAAETSERGKSVKFEYLFNLLDIYNNCKIMLTSRIEYFRSLQEQSAVLKSNEENVDTIYLKLFEEQQIRKFLERMKGEPVNNWYKLKAIKGLEDLARRPVLLTLIVKHLTKIYEDSRIEKHKAVKSIDLFNAAIDYELKEIKRKEVFKDYDREYGTNDETRLDILQKICVSLFTKNQLSIPILEISEYIKDAPYFKNKTSAQIENYLTLFHTFTFFARDKDDIFRISHKAFIDYLAAKELSDEIDRDNTQNFARHQTSVEINHFISEMIQDKTQLEKIVKAEAEPNEQNKWLKSNAVNIILKIDNPKYDKIVDFNGNIISLNDSHLENISILKELKNLKELYLSRNQISELEPLKELKKLTILEIAANQITELEPLKELKNLKVLFLTVNQISELEPLKELQNLTALDLSENQISELEPLKELMKLTYLYLSENQITELEPLKELKNLKELDLSENQITNLEPLKELWNLTDLDLSENQVTELEPLKELQNLTEIDLSENQITELEPLKDLQNLTVLYLDNNQITNLEPLKELWNLTDLELSGNQITELEPLKDLQNLTVLYLDNNQITNLEPLKELWNLTELKLSGNQITELEPLKKLDNLRALILSENQITELEPLKKLDYFRELIFSEIL